MKALTDAAFWDAQCWSAQRPMRLRWLYRDQDYESVQWLARAAGGATARIIELGGGGSRLLPYVARKFGNPTVGSDFSLRGCHLLKENFRLQGVRGDVVCEDFLHSSLEDGAFDVVYSAGVIEHFEDLHRVLTAHLRLVKPGGRLLVTVPNLQGVQGKIHRRYAPRLWSRHVVFGPADLVRIFQQLGLEGVRSGYLGSFFLHIGRNQQWTGTYGWPAWQRASVYWLLRSASAGASLLFRLLPWRPHGRAFSPAFFALGVKPSSEARLATEGDKR